MTAIAYANPGWREGHGGKLRLWLPHKGSQPTHDKSPIDAAEKTVKEGTEGGAADIEPLAGRLVIFLSGAIDHAVLPSVSDRVALTCWLW